jgi:hypothetical protein
MLPAMRRLPRIARAHRAQSYFVLHAPAGRQDHRPLALGHELTAAGQHLAVLLSMEVGAAFPDDTGAAELAILDAWRDAARARLPADLQPPPWPEASPGRRIGAASRTHGPAPLRARSSSSSTRSTRSGPAPHLDPAPAPRRLPNRPGDFPLLPRARRPPRRPRLQARPPPPARRSQRTASPFNIKDASLTLRNFTADEVRRALRPAHRRHRPGLHARRLGPRLRAHRRPALARQRARQGGRGGARPDPATPITAADIDAAKEALIRRQDTHLDSLAERLREPRVRRIIEPILAGDALPAVPEDDLRYVHRPRPRARRSERRRPGDRQPDLPRGDPPLARQRRHRLAPAHPADLAHRRRQPRRGAPARRLPRVLAAARRAPPGAAPYHEIAPHLVLMAFLHRVANGGGTIEREYAIGSGRMDLLHPLPRPRLAIELKVWRDQEPTRSPRASSSSTATSPASTSTAAGS